MRTRAFVLRVVRAALVVLALSSVGTSHVAVAQDRELAESPDFRVRVQAALRLAHQGGAQATRELEVGLRDAHPAVRVACAVALGNLGDRASIAPLEAASKSETFATVKTAMKEAVDKLRGRSVAATGAATGVENAKWVVQVGAMHNNSGVKSGDLDAVMKQAATSKAKSIRGAFFVDSSDESVLKRAADRKIPVLLVDGNLTRLTSTTGHDGGTIVTAQVDLSIRKIPQQVLKGTVSANASASDDAHTSSNGIAQLQARAVGGAVESAMGSVSSEIASFAK
jgi:HEAT repeats